MISATRLTDAEFDAIMSHGMCPDCGHPMLTGPRGCDMMNVVCINPDCMSEFNVYVADWRVGFRNGKADALRSSTLFGPQTMKGFIDENKKRNQ